MIALAHLSMTDNTETDANMTTKMRNRTDQVLPPENEVVMTLSKGGIQQTLKRQGNLWFCPDGSMYVYYTPVYWWYESNDER